MVNNTPGRRPLSTIWLNILSGWLLLEIWACAIRRFCKNCWNQQWRQLQEAFAVWLAEGQAECVIALDGSQRLVLAGRLLRLTAERHIVGDLLFQDEAEEPDEPDDDEDDDFTVDVVDEGQE